MTSPSIDSQRLHSQRGQTFVAIAVFVGTILLAVMGLATDYAQIWAHRQMAQGAADAACEAGAADLLLKFQDPTAATAFPQVDFGWIGTAYDCSTNTGSPPCKYASLNGYTGSTVNVSFPASLPGVPAIPAGFGTIANPYIQVSITDPVPMTFTRLVSANKTFNISAKAGCGMVSVNAPVPITVLSPTASPSVSLSGSSPKITIYGGPQRSIQVDSHAATALSGGAEIDLSHADPTYTGGDIAVFGGPNANPGVNLGSTGNYLSPAAPIGDPFATVPAVSNAGMPVQPAGGSAVAYHTNGCPDTGGCFQYLPGYYPTGISIGPGSKVVAIFDPGVYYVKGGISLNSNSIVRPSAANATTAPYGEIFYLTGCTGSNCISINSNSGSKTTTDDFSTTTLACPGGPAYAAPPGLTPPSQGNMLMAPCTGPYGNATGQYRGILFYVDHAISGVSASWGGGGGFILAGAFYAHSNAYTDVFTMQGNPGSTSLVIGNMVIDTLSMGGTPKINMQLNPSATYPILKVQLLE